MKSLNSIIWGVNFGSEEVNLVMLRNAGRRSAVTMNFESEIY